MARVSAFGQSEVLAHACSRGPPLCLRGALTAIAYGRGGIRLDAKAS